MMTSVLDTNSESDPASAQYATEESGANEKASPSSAHTRTSPDVQSPDNGPTSSWSSAVLQHNVSETDLGDISMSSEARIENAKEPIEEFSWDDLEDRYQKRMQECEKTEAALYEEFQNWMKV